jgi:hypothetical protein
MGRLVRPGSRLAPWDHGHLVLVGGGLLSVTGPVCCLTIQDNDLPVILGVVVVSSSGLHGRPI